MRGPRNSSTRHHPDGREDEKARETTNTFSGSLPSEGRNANDPGCPNPAPSSRPSLTHPLQKCSRFGDLYQYQSMELQRGMFPKAPNRISAPLYYWAGWTKKPTSPPLWPDSELQCGVKSRIPYPLIVSYAKRNQLGPWTRHLAPTLLSLRHTVILSARRLRRQRWFPIFKVFSRDWHIFCISSKAYYKMVLNYMPVMMEKSCECKKATQYLQILTSKSLQNFKYVQGCPPK